MDRILEKLVEAEAGAVVENPGAGGDHSLNTDDVSMNDVMKVLTGFEDFADAVGEAEDHQAKGIDEQFTNVQDMAKVVDKAALADEKVLDLNHRQIELEKRFHDLSRRLNKLRCLCLGTHVTEELRSLHEYSEKAAPPLPLPPMTAPPPPPTGPPPPTFAAPRMPNLNIGQLRPPLPDGVVLPSVPASPVPLPTQPLAPTTGPPPNATPINPAFPPLPNTPDFKIKEEIDEQKFLPQTTLTQKKIPPPSLEEKQKVDEILGQLSSNLKHLVDTYDSEATDSSSGGESCDEMDNFSHRNERIAPIKKRAKWTWLHNRASIASKWTWLTAQISDLEYRIRQQTDFYRQIRAAKGAVTLGEPTISWPAHAKKAVHDPGTEVPLSVKPPTRDYSRVDSTGRKIIIKELAPMAISPEELAAAANQNDDTFTACRTRPVKTLRRRRILGTLGLHRTSNRAAKEATVRCDCIRPGHWCAICFGRSNHAQAPDSVFHDKSRIAALLDHSYHQVLSSKSDVRLDLHMMQMIKNRSWLMSGTQPKPKTEVMEDAKKKKKLKKLSKEELLENKNRKKLKRRESESALGHRPKMTKKIKSQKASEKHRRKSVTVHHQDGVSMVDIGAVSDDANDASPLPSPSVGSGHHQLSLAEQIRKKRETAFDIDNIVIPYSIAASTRVEKLKYKEILTPTWRVVDEAEKSTVVEAVTSSPPKESPVVPPTPPPVTPSANPEVKTPVTGTKRQGSTRKSSKNNKKPKLDADKNAAILLTAEMAEVAASATTTEAEFTSQIEDISETSYEIRHDKAEIEERKRWSKPLKVIGLSTSSSRNRSQRRQNSQAEASSGYNTPDPMSPSQVDSVEVSTRPSTPDPEVTINPNAATIKNRRRTSSTTIKSRDRNPSEDAQSSRCTTPGTSDPQQPLQQPLQPPAPPYSSWVDPYEPLKFPLSDEDFNKMLEEMPSGFDPSDTPDMPAEIKQDSLDSSGVSGAMSGGSGEPVGAPVPSSRRASSQDSSNFDEEVAEDLEGEDPDWSGDHEDPDDPEWTGREELPAAVSAGNTPKSSTKKTQPQK